MSSDLKKINKNPYRHNGEITLLKNKRGSNNLLEKKNNNGKNLKHNWSKCKTPSK